MIRIALSFLVPHATGEAVAGSDVDLLVVKDTELRPIDRRIPLPPVVAYQIQCQAYNPLRLTH